MSFFRFLSEAARRLVSETSLKKDVQEGIVGVVKGGFGHVTDLLNKGKVDEAKAFSAEMTEGAESISTAVVENTVVAPTTLTAPAPKPVPPSGEGGGGSVG